MAIDFILIETSPVIRIIANTLLIGIHKTFAVTNAPVKDFGIV